LKELKKTTNRKMVVKNPKFGSRKIVGIPLTFKNLILGFSKNGLKVIYFLPHVLHSSKIVVIGKSLCGTN